MAHVGDLVLEQQEIRGAEVPQHPVDILPGDIQVRPAGNNDAVLPLRVDLNDGMAADRIRGLQITGIDAVLLQQLPENGTVRSDSARVEDLRAAASQGNGLVEPFPAAEPLVLLCQNRLLSGDKVFHFIDPIDIQGTEIQNPHNPSPLYGRYS